MKANKNKVLILTNPLNHEGGVVNFYSIFFKTFKNQFFVIEHFSIGSPMFLFYMPILKRVLYPFFLALSIVHLILKLIFDRSIAIIQVNPSLIPIPIIRDFVVLFLAKIFRKKVIVFFHGWNKGFFLKLIKTRFSSYLFVFILKITDKIIVLSNSFKNDLVNLGIDFNSILVTTTMINVNQIHSTCSATSGRPKFVFLARISKMKGITETLEAVRMLVEINADFEFEIIGHWESEDTKKSVETIISNYGLADSVNFVGRLDGKLKFEKLANSDVYIFPSWTEGCPTSVLEALASGLFVIATDVGALPELIRDNENGRLIRVKDSVALFRNMVWAIQNIQEIRRLRPKIKEKAIKSFNAESICSKFGLIYTEIAHRGP